MTGPICETVALVLRPALELAPGTLTPAAAWLPATPWPLATDPACDAPLGTPGNAPPASRALQVPLRDERIVAADFDVDIVFERQRDGVLRGQVQSAGAHQLLEARRIRETHGRHGDRPGTAGR